MLVLELCRRYGWTYNDYLSQPHWFTELAIEKMIIDSKKAKRAAGAVQ